MSGLGLLVAAAGLVWLGVALRGGAGPAAIAPMLAIGVGAGKPASLAAFKGQKVVVNFWASWCGPCVEEMPELVALSHQYRQKGIRFIGIGVDSNQNVKNFLQKVKVDYPVFVSGYAGADLARNFGNTAGALPFTVVIDETGKIRETKLGQIQPAELKKTLDAL
ncbi:TlpA family protein disulfide reductase [Burkholderia latens]|uniref:TlpA family protein disulfide reductase n=1 Tax=Burkholderia latens TaxID=488446 RepID=A0A6H9SJ31_9BURK|nr:TlpA disulfide reductase family protein [Burkholderia latens]KAB0632277.1 TlpA family protein disulfide reductase [Burkholderia latens]